LSLASLPFHLFFPIPVLVPVPWMDANLYPPATKENKHGWSFVNVQDNEQNMLLVRSTGICNRRSACNVDEACWYRIVSHQLTIAPRGAEATAASFNADLKAALMATTLNSFCSAHRLTIIKTDLKYTDMWFENKDLEHAFQAGCFPASCLEKRDRITLPLAQASLSWCAFTAKICAGMNPHQSSAAAKIWRIHWQSWGMTSRPVRPFLLLRTCCHITSMKWLRADSIVWSISTCPSPVWWKCEELLSIKLVYHQT
jgi:hypothetical protein